MKELLTTLVEREALERSLKYIGKCNSTNHEVFQSKNHTYWYFNDNGKYTLKAMCKSKDHNCDCYGKP